MEKPSYLNFDSEQYPWKTDINYREGPECYKIGKGGQGGFGEKFTERYKKTKL